MSRELANIAWALLALMLVGLGPRSVRAQDHKEVILNLRVGEREETPASVCVVSQAPSNTQVPLVHYDLRSGEPLSAGRFEEIEKFRDDAFAALSIETRARLGPLDEELIRALERMIPGNERTKEATEQSRPPAGTQGATKTESSSEEWASHEPTCTDKDDPGVGENDLCVAKIELSERLVGQHVACTSNASRGSNSKVLWLKLTSHDGKGATPVVRELLLNGNVLSIRTNFGGREPLVIEVIGGHYAPTGDALVHQDPVTLELAPRCRWRRLTMPPVSLVGMQFSTRESSNETSGFSKKPQAEPGDDEGWGLQPSFQLRQGPVSSQGRRQGGAQAIASECIRGPLADGSVEVLLPRAKVGHGSTLTAELKQWLPDTYAWNGKLGGEESRANPLKFESSWNTVEPPANIAMRAKVLTFFWQRESCFYPVKCPKASIHGMSGSCRSAYRPEPSAAGEPSTPAKASSPDSAIDGCYYRCELEDSAAGSTPGGRLEVPVTFTGDVSVDPEPEWSTSLTKLNDYIDERLEPTDLYIRINFEHWTFLDFEEAEWKEQQERAQSEGKGKAPKMPWAIRHRIRRAKRKPGLERPTRVPLSQVIRPWGDSDDISAVILRDDQGKAHRLEFDLQPGIERNNDYYGHIPDVRCGEGLSLEIEGQRFYRTTPVVVDKGEIKPRHPMSVARTWYLGLGADLVATRAIRPDPENTGWKIGGLGSIALRWKPRRVLREASRVRSWRFDLLRFEGIVSQSPYRSLTSESGRTSERFSYRGYLRLMWGSVVRTPELVHWGRTRFSAGFGMMLSGGHPLLRSNRRYLGRWDFGLTPVIDLQARLTKRLELRALARFVCLEDLHEFDTDLRGRADDAVRERARCTFIGGGGLSLTL